MRTILILGDAAEERAWAAWIRDRKDLTLATATNPDDGLSIPNLGAAIVGGPLDSRSEALRRAAADGLPIIALHPPGSNADPYYQVSMSHRETGAVIVPDMPLRLHPGIARLRAAIESQESGEFRSLRLSVPAKPGDDLARFTFARVVDAVRALLGEIQSVTASGDPDGANPEQELVVHLRDERGRRAEVRVSTEPDCAARMILVGSQGSLTLEYDTALERPARLIGRSTESGDDRIEELAAWDARAAVLSAFEPSDDEPSPSLLDGARAMELAEAVVQSLRRGRTIDFHHEPIDERTNFRALMTSLGCLMFVGFLVVFTASLAGRALGFEWAVYLAYVIPPVLIAFVVLQVLQLGIGREERE